MPDLPTTFLYGLSDGFWHALGRHDPEYRVEIRKSEKLTAEARRNAVKAGLDPETVPDVTVRIPLGVDGPGHGRTICGIEGLPLEAIGVAPEDGDPLCPACKAKVARQTRIEELQRELDTLR